MAENYFEDAPEDFDPLGNYKHNYSDDVEEWDFGLRERLGEEGSEEAILRLRKRRPR